MRASDIKKGQAVIVDGKLYVVTNADHNTPGNLRAKVQFKLRDVSKGTIQDKRVGATDDTAVPVFTSTVRSARAFAVYSRSFGLNMEKSSGPASTRISRAFSWGSRG